jgi:hypothetical protein
MLSVTTATTATTFEAVLLPEQSPGLLEFALTSADQAAGFQMDVENQLGSLAVDGVVTRLICVSTEEPSK